MLKFKFFYFPVFLFILLLIPALTVSAGTIQLQTIGTQKILILPSAADHSPIISLGKARDPQSKKNVEGYAIIHYKTGYGNSNSGSKLSSTTKCFSFLGKGARWKSAEDWVVNPTNSRGLDADYILDNLSHNIDKWEDATDGIVGNGVGYNILGNGSLITEDLAANVDVLNGKNEIYFADISNPGAIAVTIIWGKLDGPMSQRELVEWGQIYDDVDFDWSASGEAGKMDFENIATHELGHSVGMNDLYGSSCANETMYGYGAEGETKKRDLNSGDISGINKLY